MISTIIIWIYILLITSVYGLILLNILQKIGIIKKTDIQSIQVDLISLNGFCFLTFILSVISIFYKIGPITHLILFFAALIYVLFNLKDIQVIFAYHFKNFIGTKETSLFFYGISILIVLFCSILPISQFDTGYYHAQAIQWIEKYGVVPGLGNISPVLAYNQSIYLLSAFFSFSFLKIQSFHLINSYLFLLLSTRLISLTFNKSQKYNFLYTGLLIFYISSYHRLVSSCGTDIPVFIFIAYISLLFLENKTKEFDFTSFLILLFSFTVITIKLSSIPILLLVFSILYSTYRYLKIKKILILFFLFTLFLTPWITRNIILSGYIVYPFSALDIVNVDWKVPANDVKTQKEFIRSMSYIPISFNGLPEKIKQNEFKGIIDQSKEVNSEFQNISFKDKITNLIWHNNLFRLILSVLSFLTIIVLPFVIRRYNKLKDERNLIILWIVLYLSIIFWSITAPMYRFASVLLFLNLLSGFYLLIQIINPGLLANVKTNIVLGLIEKTFLIVFLAFILIKYFPDIQKNWLFQYPYKEIETVQISGNVNIIRTPKNIEEDFFRCWNAPITCIPCQADTVNFIFRTNNIKDGFKPR